MSIYDVTGKASCILPTSSGTPYEMTQSDRSALSDLKVLSLTQCLDEDTLQGGTLADVERKKMTFHQEFYCGITDARWWNFMLEEHVLRRTQVDELLGIVSGILEDADPRKEDNSVPVINVFHQPGAGGTTVAKGTLWELKSRVRCCVVKRITDQTCHQIDSFRRLGDTGHLKAPIILIDNEDEEKIFKLRLHLGEKARQSAANFPPDSNTFCVLIICIRRPSLPEQTSKYEVMLGHDLHDEEVKWFENECECMEEKIGQKHSPHFKLLMSFNAWKQNFSPVKLTKYVCDLVHGIRDNRELRLLKYVALINSFQINIRWIPISNFNAIMCSHCDVTSARRGLWQTPPSEVDPHWDTCLTQPLKILLNMSSESSPATSRKIVRISSGKFAKKILCHLRQRENQTISEVVTELFQRDVFKTRNSSPALIQLTETLTDLLKRRADTTSGRERFSPIITAIGEKEGYQTAAEVLETVFDILKDPLIAQQVARIYIFINDWEEADRYALLAHKLQPENSYICDTYGQVYKQQLNSFQKNQPNTGPQLPEGEKVRKIISFGFKAIDIFREEQTLSYDDCNGDYNNCGFFSELRTIVMLLDLCRSFKVFKGKNGVSTLHRFLVDEEYALDDLEAEVGEKEKDIERLKCLYEDYERPLRRIEDEQIQLTTDSSSRNSASCRKSINDYSMLEHLQRDLNKHFGESSDEIPSSLSPEDACEFRRRRVKYISGFAFRSLYMLRDSFNAKEKFGDMLALILHNVESDFCNAFDLKTVLNLTLAQISLDKKYSLTPSMKCVLGWSKQLYDLTTKDSHPYLEGFLYFVIFNWPTSWRESQGLALCSCKELSDVIKKWKNMFFNNHPSQRNLKDKKPDVRQGVTVCFLGTGKGFDEIVLCNEIPGFKYLRHKVKDITLDVSMTSRLKWLTGTLQDSGDEILFIFRKQQHNQVTLKIPVLDPVTDKSLQGRKVRFVLGFSWSGPKAFCVTSDEGVSRK